MRPLFIAGPARSGTTALADYLNQHEEILVCRERYKRVVDDIDPSFFTFGRILDYEPQPKGGETNVPREYHEELLESKDPAKLSWIGDKHPGYVRELKTLAENNPGARFILTYRPVEEVAESFEARSKNPDDSWLGGKNGFRLGVNHWNRAMRSIREFIEGEDTDSEVLVVSYHDFFYRNEDCVPLISRFLEIEFDAAVLAAWREMSSGFEGGRRRKELPTEKQRAFLEETRDRASEEWVVRYIERQWRELETDRPDGGGPNGGGPNGGATDGRWALAAGLMERRSLVRDLDRELERLESNAGNLEKKIARIGKLKRRNRELTAQARSLQGRLRKEIGPRVWGLLGRANRLRHRLLKSR